MNQLQFSSYLDGLILSGVWRYLIAAIFILAVLYELAWPTVVGFDGVVIDYELRTRNHGLPRVVLKCDDGDILELSNMRFLFEDLNIELGDRLSKRSFSNICRLNSESIECVR